MRTIEKNTKHSPATRVFYISLLFSNALEITYDASEIHGLGFFICQRIIEPISPSKIKQVLNIVTDCVKHVSQGA